MTCAIPSHPTNLLPRFGLFIEMAKRAMGEGIRARDAALAPLAILLANYLSATLRRLTALHVRFAAGKLPAAPRRGSAPRPAAERATAGPRPERRPPAMPRGPVLLTLFQVMLCDQLRALLDDPEMRALLAAAPQAGRLLRPLWRKLSADPLPEVLRLPRRPRQPRPPRVAVARTAPDLRLVTLPDGSMGWEPTPCFPALGRPPRAALARAAEPPAPVPAPPALPARPPPRDAPRAPEPARPPRDYSRSRCNPHAMRLAARQSCGTPLVFHIRN